MERTTTTDWQNGKLTQWILPFVVFGALWLMLITRLSLYWATYPQYAFGWFVPFICAYLFLIRWKSRPAGKPGRSAAATWVFSLAGLALLPTWLVSQPNPDWRLISWLLGLEIVGLSLCAIYFVGGRSWVAHFAFGVCLILVSVPWPGGLEYLVTRGLTRVATSVTVASLNLFHIAATQHGNLIELQTGSLGVDEACSGIRSIQAALMVTLFLGELYQASARRRLALVISGMIIAFLCNVARTFLLGAIAAKYGVDSVSNWHDPAGYLFLALCFVFIWGLARLVGGRLPELQPTNAPAPIRVRGKLICALGVWVMLTVVGTEFWYRSHEGEAKVQWSVAWPVGKKDFSNITISERESVALGCDEQRASEWTNDDGSHWTAFFFKWPEGPSRSRILARMHRPENCLPAAGYKLCADRGIIRIQAENISIPFHALDFEYAKERLYVFFCLWQDGSKGVVQGRIRDVWTRFARLESALLGERNLGQQTLEIVISGYDSPEEAQGALRRELEGMIRIQPSFRSI
jgi:exosortase